MLNSGTQRCGRQFSLNYNSNIIFLFVQGSDPRVATCRGRLQTRRCQLNQEINKELRLRAGAENLFKVSIDTVCLLVDMYEVLKNSIHLQTASHCVPHGKVGEGNLLLRNCDAHFLPNFRDIN